MNKKEQDVIQKIKEKTGNIMVPEDMKPDRIRQTLGEADRRKGKKISPFRIGALAAACLVIVAGIVVYKAGRTGEETGTGERIGTPARRLPEISSEETVASADNYDEVFEYIDNYKKETEAEQRAYEEEIANESGAAEKKESAVDMDVAEAALADTAGAADGGSYSETNVRQEGVDEGDVVKTDGTYLYVLRDSREEVSIVDTRGGKMKETSSIKTEKVGDIQEIYLDSGQKRLVLVCSKYDDDGLMDRAFAYEGMTIAITYDLTDTEKPKELGRVTQSGYYQSSRMAEGYLYLFSNYGVDWSNIERGIPETYIPRINDTFIAEKDICLPQIKKGRAYTIAAAVNIEKPDEVADSKAILSEGGQLYVSNENIYYYETVWGSGSLGDDEQTTIRSISYKKGVLTPGMQGTVKGYINDSFSIDEYKGYLRIVTTRGEANSVYVLDKDFKIVGSIENLAKDERVYSARLMGDIGYFVTFRETDPLFTVDLSNPKKPKIIGSLKIPGFSDYLHPYGEGKLLGIGMNVDEETMITDGVKLTMFDISDPSDVKEENTCVLKNVYSTDVSYDYKAALVDAGRNLIGFAGDTNGGQNYYIFKYDTSRGFISQMEEEINGNGSTGTRGVYIDETLYVVRGNIIEAYSLKHFKKVGDIIL